MWKALCLALLLVNPVAAQPVIPDNPMGRTLSAFLEAFNTGDATRIEAFNRKYHFIVPTQVQLAYFHQTGGYVLRKVVKSDATSIDALVQEKDSDAFQRMTFQEAGTATTAKLSIQLADVPRPAEFAVPRLTQAEAIKALDAHARVLAARGNLSGAMLIAHKGKIIYSHSWGLADRAGDIPDTVDTKFRLGSCNKMFTAVAVLQLVAAGKVSLDGTVEDYLPDYPNKDVARMVTVRMLLNHSGGTGDIFGPEFVKNRLKLKNNEDYIALFGKRKPLFKPGTQEAYSNFGFVILGSIIQHVSGEDYYAYVRDHIFRPAGMTDTGSLPETVAVPGRAVAYTFKNGKWVNAASTLPLRGTAAGGGYSTVGDMLKFAEALESDKLLPPALKEEATHFETKGKWYGFGFAVSGAKGPDHWYGHGGGAPGMNADFRVFPYSQTVIVALANVDPPVADRLVEFYIDRMPLE
jgi:CubicO group peptidase (beta-lactamase class C family)